MPAAIDRAAARRAAADGTTDSTIGCRNTSPTLNPTTSARTPIPIVPATRAREGPNPATAAQAPNRKVSSRPATHVPRDEYRSSTNPAMVIVAATHASEPVTTAATRTSSAVIVNATATAVTAPSPTRRSQGHSTGAGSRRISPLIALGLPSTTTGMLQAALRPPDRGGRTRASCHTTEWRPRSTRQTAGAPGERVDPATRPALAAVGDAVLTATVWRPTRTNGSPRYPRTSTELFSSTPRPTARSLS